MSHPVPLRLSPAPVLVTGAAGFLGASLVRRLLDQGCEVHALVRASTQMWRIEEIRSRLVLHRVDLLDEGAVRSALERSRPQTVFHLAIAGIHPVDPEGVRRMLRTCVEGTYNLLESAAMVDVRQVVHLGSSLEYGPRDRPLKETDPLEPTTLRGSAKAAQTLLALMLGRSSGISVTVVRPFTVYGPWEPPSKLIPQAFLAALRGREIELTAAGYRRDLVFVDDVVDACLRIVENDSAIGETINVGSGRQWSNEEVVELVGEVAGRKLTTRVGAYPPRPPDTAHWVADVTKARRLLGWEARHDLRSGLERTLAWMRPRLDSYDALTTGAEGPAPPSS